MQSFSDSYLKNVLKIQDAVFGLKQTQTESNYIKNGQQNNEINILCPINKSMTVSMHNFFSFMLMGDCSSDVDLSLHHQYKDYQEFKDKLNPARESQELYKYLKDLSCKV